ncbi:NAD-dependent epimerase/dehydratase family protein [Thermoflexus sp.]|uniref:NAD-dependent epimerase/dehydratase family protein n=2 Tax=Thermoflexus sp. TaxID=1969742 RepID=UPI0025F5A4E6|nr:NAD-dependent epimerase/dehydratase family protein [Thermoflexus sp.]MCS7351500.1 NAD-dependent epimerase/dehydratase family protein [Thermoflexus sp.]MCX7691069.1 NAD-dependent epimerase/dehydratase family protein [Thermoflexus sp.]MDW8180957.1 NAD-dependent epimerase/dehydratase family protein [Anaerolineae bacterium]
MRVLVTGGAGFIGSHLVERLLAEGYEVTVLDDLSGGQLGNLSGVRDHPRLRVIVGDVRDPAALRMALGGVEAVFHLAAVVGVPRVLADPVRTIQVNVEGTQRVLEACAERGISVCVASSSEVYGKGVHWPAAEGDDLRLGPPTSLRWAYAVSKLLDEHLALAWARHGLRVSVVRYFNVYGPRADPHGYGYVIARFMDQALRGEPLTVYGDGRQTRSFIYVTDAVEGTLRAGLLPAAFGHIFNIGCAEEISILDLAEKIRAVTGCQVPIRFLSFSEVYGPEFEEIPRRVPEVSRARALLGFEARVTLDEGLQRTWEWWRTCRRV